MMESSFNSLPLEEQEGEWIAAGNQGSGRYDFFKVRINGMLHFVKRPAREFENDLLTRESLRKEFVIAYPLNHPSIARYLKFDGTALYEEYIDGTTLREMIDSGDDRLKERQFIEAMARQLFEALEYLHSQGVVHLDIKPENVMISNLGNRLKLIDFSGAKSDSLNSTPGFTKDYMAPEQKGGTVGPATDIYLAAQTIGMAVEAAGCQKNWRRFIQQATHNEPSKRFSSAKEALEAIPKTNSTGNRKLVALVIGVILIIGFTTFLFLKIGDKETTINKTEENDISTEPISPGDSVKTPDHLQIAPEEERPNKVKETEKGESVEDKREAATNEPAKEKQTISSQTIPSENIPNSTQLPPSATNEEIEAEINKNIEKYVDDNFEEIVGPYVYTYRPSPLPSSEHIHRNAAHAAMDDVEKGAKRFQELLHKRYPEKEDYINQVMRQTLARYRRKVDQIINTRDESLRPEGARYWHN